MTTMRTLNTCRAADEAQEEADSAQAEATRLEAIAKEVDGAEAAK